MIFYIIILIEYRIDILLNNIYNKNSYVQLKKKVV